MEALVAYYRKYEATVPDFTRRRRSSATSELARDEFQGRSTEADGRRTCRWRRCWRRRRPGSTQPLTFTREGAGTLFYTARLRYAADRALPAGLDSGIPHRAHATRRTSRRARGRRRRRYKAGDLVRVTLTLRPDEGAALRGRHRSAARRLRAGRVVVRHDGRVAGARSRTTRASATRRLVRTGGSAAASITSSATTTASSCSPRASSEGRHEFSYIVRATTAGTFRTAPARAEEMYEPEVFGRTATAVIEVKAIEHAALGTASMLLALRRARVARRSAVVVGRLVALARRRALAAPRADRRRRCSTIGRRDVDGRRRSARRAAVRGAVGRRHAQRAPRRAERCRRCSSRRRWRPRIGASGRTPASIRSPSRARCAQNLAEGRVVEGGSTITQQVAKLLLSRAGAEALARRAARRSARRSSRCGSSIASTSARCSRCT